MDRTEKCFIFGGENSFAGLPDQSITSSYNRTKMGEVYKLENREYSLVCGFCSEEFQYFSEFTLHVEEHLHKLAAENLHCEVKMNDENERNCSSGDEFNQFDDGNFDDYNQEIEDKTNIKIEEGVEIEHSQFVTNISKSVKQRSKPAKKRKASKAFADDNNDNVTVKIEQQVASFDANDTKDPLNKFRERLANIMPYSRVVDTPQARLLAQYYLLDSKIIKRSGKSFNCPLCEKAFKSHYIMRRHIFVAHASENYFVCGLCSESFRAPRYLETHFQVKHRQGKPSYECFVCHRPFSYYKKLTQHIPYCNVFKIEEDSECDTAVQIKVSQQSIKKYKKMRYMNTHVHQLPAEVDEAVTENAFKMFRDELSCTIPSARIIETSESKLLAHYSMLDYRLFKRSGKSFICPLCDKIFKVSIKYCKRLLLITNIITFEI